MSGTHLTKKEAHQILGVPSDASESDIRKAYLQLARKHHPDKCQDKALLDDFNARFKSISGAFQRLTDDAESSDDEDIYEDDYSTHSGGGGMDFFSFFSFMSKGEHSATSNPFDDYFDCDDDNSSSSSSHGSSRSANYPRESVGSGTHRLPTEEERQKWRDESRARKEAERQQRIRRKVYKQERKASHLEKKTRRRNGP